MTSKDSKFYINIENELGLSYKRQRSALLGVALAKPANYYNLRAKLVQQLTVKQVKDAYDLYWGILKYGIIGAEQVKNKDELMADVNLVPDLPEHLINKFASRIAATLEEIAEECVNMILPDDFLKLAQEKQKGVLSANGLLG